MKTNETNNDSMILLDVKTKLKDAYHQLTMMKEREPALEAEFIRLNCLINSYIGGRYREAGASIDALFELLTKGTIDGK